MNEFQTVFIFSCEWFESCSPLCHLQAFTSTGIKKGEFFLGDLNTQLKNNNVTTDIKVDTSSNLWCSVFVFYFP
jgi:hypothetical protein